MPNEPLAAGVTVEDTTVDFAAVFDELLGARESLTEAEWLETLPPSVLMHCREELEEREQQLRTALGTERFEDFYRAAEDRRAVVSDPPPPTGPSTPPPPVHPPDPPEPPDHPSSITNSVATEFRLALQQYRLDLDDHAFRYACALFSELAYYLVQEFEVDMAGERRTKLVPSDAFQDLVRQRRSLDIAAALRDTGLERAFTVATSRTVVHGVWHREILFVAMRGTRFLHDWDINSQAWMMADDGADFYHRGFVRESARVAAVLSDYEKLFARASRVVFTGHSLGGAVAAVTQALHYPGDSLVCTFGAPRFGPRKSMARRRRNQVDIIQQGDRVPYVPPKIFGYADSDRCRDPRGQPAHKLRDRVFLAESIVRFALFLIGMARWHDVATYRQAVATTVSGANVNLGKFSAETMNKIER